MDEPGPDTPVVKMSEALDPVEAAFYSREENVIELTDKSEVLFREIEAKFGFVGGTYSEYLLYFHRRDMDPRL